MRTVKRRWAHVPAYAFAARPGTAGGGRMESVGRALRRCAVIIPLRAAPCCDESRNRASANRPPESFINGLVFTLKGLTLVPRKPGVKRPRASEGIDPGRTALEGLGHGLHPKLTEP